MSLSFLSKGNQAFKEKKYSDAVDFYNKFVVENPQLSGLIKVNLELANRRLSTEKKELAASASTGLDDKLQEHSLYRHKLEQSDAGSIRGWCINEKKPSEVFGLDVLIDGHFYIKIKNDGRRLDLKKKGMSDGLGGLEFTNPAIYLKEGQYSISLRLPDGSLSESIVVEATESELKAINLGEKFPQRGVTIIVPIYNAPDDVDVCIQRLLDYTPSFAQILLIDDCSSDERISQILARYAATESIRILRNDKNLGFTRTVNLGIAEAGQDDVVLLNSDARVTPGWLEGMLLAACSAPRIATVTAMSDRAGAFSAPDMGNDNKLPEGVDEITYARAFRRRSLGLYPRVPTGNGFCMYVSRECINSIGALDAQAFPRGYGEENDFCMRAWRAGWSNVIDDRTYVFHDRSKSFGDTKTELLAAGRAVVDERYPEYKIAIRVFSKCQKIALARNRARLAMQDCVDARGTSWLPRVLFVTATQTGGTPQTNRDLMEALEGAFDGWVMRCDSKMLELSHMSEDGKTRIVRSRKLQEPVDPLTHNSSDYDKLVCSWLQEFNFDLVHIRHLGWHGLSLPRLARQLGKKVVYSFHDFYALSSTFKLIDDQGVFLGNTYLEEGSVYRESLWPKDALPTPHGNWLAYWRERFQAALEHCDAFVTTADSARRLILDALPRLPADRFVVIPHGRDFPCFYRVRQKPKRGEPVRILVPGHINAVKGLEIIRALIEHDKAEKLEFHILGRLIGEMPQKGVVSLGAYERHEFAEKAAAVRPHLGIMFSVWDETYCHTLTELWSVGLPVAVLDFPNVADRVRRSGAGWILDHHNISNLYEEILRLAFDEQEYEKTENSLVNWQGGYGLANSTAQMAAGYLNIYGDVLREGRDRKQALSPYSRKRIGLLYSATANMPHAIGFTHGRIKDLTRNWVERDVTYIKMTPAMLAASAREKMLDGAILQSGITPLSAMDNVLMALSESNISYLLGLDDDFISQTPSSFDIAIQAALNEGAIVKKTIASPGNTVIKKTTSRARVAVFVHVFYIHILDLIFSFLRNIQQDFDLFITCPEALVPTVKNISNTYPRVKIIPVENRGMDVLPFLHTVFEHELWRYDAVLKLHTKNDKTEMGEVLGRLLLEGVLGTPELVKTILDELLLNESIGMVGSECMYRSAPKIMKPNRPGVEKILGAMSVSWPSEEWGFFAGTMFWIRGPLLEILMLNYAGVVNEAYVENKVAVTGGDGNWAHAMERVFGLLPLMSGKNIAVSYPSTEKGSHTHIRQVLPVELDFNRSYSRPSNYYVLRYKNLAAWAELCRKSDLFDEDYYRLHGRSLVPAEMDAATHFVLFGDGLGLNPSSKFSATDYLLKHLDVANARPSVPSLIHFIKHGLKEGRIHSRVI